MKMKFAFRKLSIYFNNITCTNKQQKLNGSNVTVKQTYYSFHLRQTSNYVARARGNNMSCPKNLSSLKINYETCTETFTCRKPHYLKT